MEHISKSKMLKEFTEAFENRTDKDDLIRFASRIIDIANKSYQKGYEAGKREVINLDRKTKEIL